MDIDEEFSIDFHNCLNKMITCRIDRFTDDRGEVLGAFVWRSRQDIVSSDDNGMPQVLASAFSESINSLAGDRIPYLWGEPMVEVDMKARNRKGFEGARQMKIWVRQRVEFI